MHELPTLRLPPLLSFPARLLPVRAHSAVLAQALNRLLREPLAQGELDMLQGRILGVSIEDAAVRYGLTLQAASLVAAAAAPDVTLRGDLHAFLLMLARREDPDTLFFQRRLAIDGDTALGVEIKNFLDRLEWEALPMPALLERVPQQALGVFETVLPWLGRLPGLGVGQGRSVSG